MEKVLVTGVAGFIGSNTASALLNEGYSVIGVDNFDDTYEQGFKEGNIAPFISNDHFALVRLDLRNGDALRELMTEERPDYVIHLAAKADTRQAVENPYPYIENNILGTINLFEAIKSVDSVKNTVFVSSSSVYGNDQNVPWKEDATADSPLSPYGATKRAGEMFAYAYHHNFGLNITCLRYFNAYGENNRPNMVPYKWGMALLKGEEIELSGTGTRKRDYTYVGDTVRGTLLAMKKPLGYEVINIGNNHPVPLTELLATFEKVIGTKAKVHSRESHKASVEDTYADISKAKELLGWEPETSLEEGITRLVAWLKETRL